MSTTPIKTDHHNAAGLRAALDQLLRYEKRERAAELIRERIVHGNARERAVAADYAKRLDIPLTHEDTHGH